MVNHTKSWFYVTPIGGVYAGDSPPSGSTVLVCPGGTLPDELAARYKVADRLKGSGDPPAPRDPAGNPIVVRGGKAIAASVLAEDDPDKKAVEDAVKVEDEAKAAKAKAVTAKKAAGKADDAGDDEDADDAGDDEPASGLKVKADAHGKAVHASDAGVEDKAIRKGPSSPRKK